MKKPYTEDDVKVASRAIARKNMPNASEKLIDRLVEMGEWDDAARWVLDAVAPAVAARAAARALRTAATSPRGRLSGHSGVSVRWLLAEADDIDQEAIA